MLRTLCTQCKHTKHAVLTHYPHSAHTPPLASVAAQCSAQSIHKHTYHASSAAHAIYTNQTTQPNKLQHLRYQRMSQRHSPISDPPDYTDNNTEDEHTDAAYRHVTGQHNNGKLGVGRITHALSDSAQQVIHNRYEQTRDIASYLKQQLQRNWYRTVGIIFGSIAAIAFAITVFREQVKDETAVQIADVAKRSLGSDTVQLQVNQLSQDVVRKLLADATVRREAIAFVQQFLQSPETKQMLVQLCMAIIKDEQTVQQFTVLGKQLVDRLAVDPNVQDHMVKLLHKSINHPTNVAALGRLVRNVVQEDFTKETLLQSLKLAAHQTLQDEGVQQHATEMMKRIMQDPAVQKQGGDAAWHAIKYAVGLAPKSTHSPHTDTAHDAKHGRSKSDADTAALLTTAYAMSNGSNGIGNGSTAAGSANGAAKPVVALQNDKYSKATPASTNGTNGQSAENSDSMITIDGFH